MPDDIIAKMRQLLTEFISTDLKALICKVDDIQTQLERMEKSMVVQLDACRAEMAACRAEIRSAF